MVNQYGAGGTMTVRMEGPFGSFGSLVKVGEKAVRITEVDEESKQLVEELQNGINEEVQLAIGINSKVDLQLTPEQIASVFSAGYCLTAVNDSGNVIVYAVGNKPTSDITINATITEVVK